MSPIPYHGEVPPKLYGHPFPPDPNEKLHTQIFWFTSIVLGICIGYFSFTNISFVSIAIFAIFLMFFIVMIFAIKDLKNIKTITPDMDGNQEQDDSDGPSLAEDYFSQLEWQRTHRRQHSVSLPEWRYQPVPRKYKRKDNIYLGCFIFIFASFLLAGFGAFLSSVFGVNSPIVVSIFIVLGIVGVFTWLAVKK
jgi:hypothetical protein